MSVLKNLETKIAGLVEGAFSRAFRSEVRPVEIARKLAREMDEHRTVSVSRVYVPNEYIVYLSVEDRERFEGYEEALTRELAGYLLEHARQERLALLSRASVSFRTDDRLDLGEFGIQARLVQPAADPEAEPEQGDVGNTMIYSAERLRQPLGGPARAEGARNSLLIVDGKRFVVSPRGAVLGRSRDCDVVLDDGNVSRRHAEIRPQGDGWVINDLHSTNGVLVEGHRVQGSERLRGGERIEIGTSQLRFELE